ncbi:UDP-N-acetylmuramate--L-alanine ligase [Aquimarina agarilytica]|uniref:UDP-N-acetylmuramate--L-alanine ligase n=1 Tax=Aquimarina agarilytica TaxID=1087449 RepID=UPI0002897F2C|nr:UDP-N-acetylmuramate--L-alanine ligase [Aquimarina agarilytica]
MRGLEYIENVYFIGVGGIGMSAIARYFVSVGKQVAGYDKTPTAITKALVDLGVDITFNDAVAEIPQNFLNAKNTLVVYTPAVPATHKQLVYFQDHNFEVHKRAKVLGFITKDTFTLAVAGTHGKTTTSSILAHLLYASGEKVTAFLGGISENYNSNYISSGNEVVVVEADEFDRSFLQLFPNISAITSMDADHLDIYGAHEALTDSFNAFAALTKNELFVVKGLPMQGVTIGIDTDADYVAQNIKIDNGSYVFDLKTPEQLIKNLHVSLPGFHNLLNAITAFAMALKYGSPAEKLAKALLTFKGVQRRFSYQIKTSDLVYIDDYAHHPTEIKALHQAVRQMHPNKKVLAIFQPHLFSRTKDFAEEFGTSLSLFDELLLLDIYPARELPMEGVTSEWLLSLVANKNKSLVSKKALIDLVKQSDAEVIVTIGAGDIGAEVSKIKEALLA